MGGGEDFKRELGQENGVAWQNMPMYRIDYAERLQAIERTQRDFDQRLQRIQTDQRELADRVQAVQSGQLEYDELLIQTDQRELADRVQAVQSGQLEYDELLHDHQNVQKDLDRRVTSIEMDTKSHSLETLGNLRSLDDRLERIDARISSLDHCLLGHMNSDHERKKAKEEDALVQVQSLATEVERLGKQVVTLEQRESQQAFRQAEAAAQADARTDEGIAESAEPTGDRTAEILAEGLVSVTQTLQSELDTTRLLLLTKGSSKRRQGWGEKSQWGDLPREEEESV